MASGSLCVFRPPSGKGGIPEFAIQILRRRSPAGLTTDEQKWNHVFELVFPGLPCPLNPYSTEPSGQGEIFSQESMPRVPDLQTVHGGLTDSGYASACLAAYHLDTGPPTLVDQSEVRTIYSDEGSIEGTELDAYKMELADSLASKVRQLGQDPKTLRRLSEILPALLKAFALRLGQPRSTKNQRDVMYFVHKYRL